MSGQVFKSKQERASFWREIQAVFDRYPDILNGLDDVLEGEVADGEPYDPSVPKFLQGIVIIASARNVDNWESMFVLEPEDQSSYLTQGLVSAAIISFHPQSDE